MTAVFNKIESFLLTNTVWFFITGLMLLTTHWLIPDFPEKTWSAYFEYLFSLFIHFSPILLFAFFREQLKEKLHPLSFWGLWSFCFIGFLILNHPAVYDLLGMSAFGTIPMHDGFLPLVIGLLMLLTEIIIQSNDFIVRKTPSSLWLKRIDLDHLVIFFLVVFAFLSAVMPLILAPESVEVRDSVSGIFFGFIQMFIISFGGYFFYYINRHFLIPRLLKKKGIVYYVGGAVATSVIFYPIIGQFVAWMPVMKTWNYLPPANQPAFEVINLVMMEGSLPFMIILLSAPVIVAFEWFGQTSEIAVLEKEKSETELNLLKQQINPHFFFNTLNNLYALSLTKDKQTPEVILQLSELMRYVIYKGKEKEVSLEEEVKYIEDYIQLQQIRLHKKLDLKFDKAIDNGNVRIPPLLFINLIENAFKHGIEPAEGSCFLHLELRSTDDDLIFSCKNSFEEREEKNNGTGLVNLRRRLELRFPHKHELKVSESKNLFSAVLKITC